jgi:hypothetical protein
MVCCIKTTLLGFFIYCETHVASPCPPLPLAGESVARGPMGRGTHVHHEFIIQDCTFAMPDKANG